MSHHIAHRPLGRVLTSFLLASLGAGLAASPAWAAKARASKKPAAAAARPAPALLQSSTTLADYGQRNPGQQQVSDWIVAVVNSEPITHQELQARLVRIELQLQNAGQALPDRAELAQQLLQKMIDDRAQVQEAKEIGMLGDYVYSANRDSAINGASSNTYGYEPAPPQDWRM